MVTPYPTPHRLGVRRYVEGVEDRYGNATASHGPAEAWPVYGYWAPQGGEPWREARDLSEVDVSIVAPAGPLVPGRRDLVVIEGVEHTVEGDPADYTHGPFGFEPGVVVNVRRVEG